MELVKANIAGPFNIIEVLYFKEDGTFFREIITKDDTYSGSEQKILDLIAQYH